MTATTWLPIALAGFGSLIAPFAVRPILRRLHVVDVPNLRSSHTVPTLRGGGIAPLVGFAIGMTIATAQAAGPVETGVLAAIGGTAIAAGAVGLAEDLRGLRVAVRASLQLILGLIAAVALGTLLDAPWWTIALGGLLVAAYINVANFMDGINAISGLHGLVVGVSFAIVGSLTQLLWLSTAGGVIAIVFAAFLPWNLRRPHLFLGDVGSYLLGCAVAATAIGAVFAGVPPVAAIAPLSLYLADTGYTLIRRIIRGDRWHEAHRTHVYQRLAGPGRSHIVVAAYVTAMTAVCSLAGIASLYMDGATAVVPAFVVIGAVILYLLTPSLLPRHRKVTN